MTTIAIDFDDTLTSHPLFWRIVVTISAVFSIRFICVTCRRNTDENKELLKEWMQENGFELTTIFTNLESKMDAVKKAGIKVSIWIDDNPSTIVHGVS